MAAGTSKTKVEKQVGQIMTRNRGEEGRQNQDSKVDLVMEVLSGDMEWRGRLGQGTSLFLYPVPNPAV